MSSAPGRAVPRTLDLALARRIALAAQGFADPRPAPGAVRARHLDRVLDRVAVVQIDSVNVLARSHYLPFYSRLGDYDRLLLDRARDQAPRRLVECWAHEASMISPALWPLVAGWMRESVNLWPTIRRFADEHPDVLESVQAVVELRGPMTARQVQAALAHDRPLRTDHWGWNWSEVKIALEYLFRAARISSAGRTASFERRYAGLAQVAPSGSLGDWLTLPGSVDAATTARELVRVAARSCGVATESCLADYFRIGRAPARAALRELVADGEVEPVTVRGWKPPAYLHVGARRPRSLHVEALVSPFDSLVWQRERTEALFGIRYRIEIYTPVAKRVHGYYVLPFLYGDRIVARCDLKADRTERVLRLKRLTWEPGAPPAARAALGRELATMAAWLGLGDVVVAPPGAPVVADDSAPDAQRA